MLPVVTTKSLLAKLPCRLNVSMMSDPLKTVRTPPVQVTEVPY